MKILITGFKPFNKEIVNPSLMLLPYYNKENITTLPLNVEYDQDALKVIDTIKDNEYDYVLLLGQAGGRKKVTVEGVALNVQNATIPDNSNNLVKHHMIIDDAPVAYQTKIDLVSLVNKVNSEFFDISYHAGTFVCNDLYYQVMHYISVNNLKAKCAFIHLPYLDNQVVDKPNMPSMKLEEMKEIIDKVIESLC